MLANLKMALAARGIRQIELARELDISADLLSRIVRGWTVPNATLRARIADFLATEAAWLFEKEVTIPAKTSRRRSVARECPTNGAGPRRV